MSSSAVRTAILDFLDDESDETEIVDLTSQYEEIKELLTTLDIQPDVPWLGVQFIGYEEVPVSLSATNDQGLYRETGAIYLHIVDIAQVGGGSSLLTRGEALRNLFRGQRIGDIVIESVSPMNFDRGATLAFEGGYMSGSFIMVYHRDLNL